MYVRGSERQLVTPGEGEGSIIRMVQTILGDSPIVPSVSPSFMKLSVPGDLSCSLSDCFQKLKLGSSLDELVISRLLQCFTVCIFLLLIDNIHYKILVYVWFTGYCGISYY